VTIFYFFSALTIVDCCFNKWKKISILWRKHMYQHGLNWLFSELPTFFRRHMTIKCRICSKKSDFQCIFNVFSMRRILCQTWIEISQSQCNKANQSATSMHSRPTKREKWFTFAFVLYKSLFALIEQQHKYNQCSNALYFPCPPLCTVNLKGKIRKFMSEITVI